MRRRDLLEGAALGALALGARPALASATAPAAPPAFEGKHAVVPLPFDPQKLKGLSPKLLTSHHDNNYAGAVKNLNKVEAELARVDKDTPGFGVSGLMERELTFRNSKALHELYFGNLGGDGKPGGALQKAIAQRYGTFERWLEQFRAVGTSLAGGSGWAVLDLNLRTGQLGISWAGNHTQTQAEGQPLLVMDMYEHAYALDFGAAAQGYIDAFFQNVQWEEVEARYQRALKAAAAIKGP